MRQRVVLKAIQPVQTGVSRRTGDVWKRQEVIVEWSEERSDGRVVTQRTVASMFGESVEMFEHCQYAVGDELECYLHFDTRYNQATGRTYNETSMSV